MPLVTLKTELVPECRIHGGAAAAAVPETRGAASFATNDPLDESTMEYRMLPHYWDCVEANEWDWGPKGRPLPVSPKNPRAGSTCKFSGNTKYCMRLVNKYR